MNAPANCTNADGSPAGGQLAVRIISFGYKQGSPPVANLTFDVRFLKNPFWVEELRPLTGKDKPVQDYVLQQPLAQEFLKSVIHMLDSILPEIIKLGQREFAIAFGCTGGQHRSATLVEALASEIGSRYSRCRIIKEHRQLDSAAANCEVLSSARGQQTSGALVQEDES